MSVCYERQRRGWAEFLVAKVGSAASVTGQNVFQFDLKMLAGFRSLSGLLCLFGLSFLPGKHLAFDEAELPCYVSDLSSTEPGCAPRIVPVLCRITWTVYAASIVSSSPLLPFGYHWLSQMAGYLWINHHV